MATDKTKVNKNEPIYNFTETVKDGKVTKKFNVRLKKPTRSLYNEADMYYSIKLNKYIKMGLLTNEQLAKRQIDIGGTFTEEQQKDYARIQSLIADKEERYLRLKAKKDLSVDEEATRTEIIKDISILRTQLIDYEYLKNQVYDHTANAKARNDVLLWWCLNITQVAEISKDKDPEEFRDMFEGDSFETKNMIFEEMQDEEDVLLTQVFSKIVQVITLWYWMNVTDKKEIEKILKASEPKKEKDE